MTPLGWLGRKTSKQTNKQTWQSMGIFFFFFFFFLLMNTYIFGTDWKCLWGTSKTWSSVNFFPLSLCTMKTKLQISQFFQAKGVDNHSYRWGGRPRWFIWMRRPTGDQEVAGSTPAEVGNILSWRLIMKYFLQSFSPFRWFKKGSCQFLAKECAQYWLTPWRTKPAQ